MRKYTYKEHGLVCTKLTQKNVTQNHDETLSDTGGTFLTFEIVIFGGDYEFCKSFIKFIVDLSYEDINTGDQDVIKSIVKIEERPIVIKDGMIVKNAGVSYFGYQCLLNRKKGSCYYYCWWVFKD